MTWRHWLRDAGESRIDPDKGIEFGDSILTTEAAARGQGVALGRTALVNDYLASGRLVRPLKESRPADYAYFMVTTPAGAEHPRIRAFLDWIELQVQQDAPVLAE